jgi:hypothetical protein
VPAPVRRTDATPVRHTDAMSISDPRRLSCHYSIICGGAFCKSASVYTGTIGSSEPRLKRRRASREGGRDIERGRRFIHLNRNRVCFELGSIAVRTKPELGLLCCARARIAVACVSLCNSRTLFHRGLLLWSNMLTHLSDAPAWDSTDMLSKHAHFRAWIRTIVKKEVTIGYSSHTYEEV